MLLPWDTKALQSSTPSKYEAPLVEFNDFSTPPPLTAGGKGAEDELLVVFLLFSDLVDDDTDGTT